jgi:hypothetical protein
VAVDVFVTVGVKVNVRVLVGVEEAVIVGLKVGVLVKVGVRVAVGLLVEVRVEVIVGLEVAVPVAVGVCVRVGVGVRVRVELAVDVKVGVAVKATAAFTTTCPVIPVQVAAQFVPQRGPWILQWNGKVPDWEKTWVTEKPAVKAPASPMSYMAQTPLPVPLST